MIIITFPTDPSALWDAAEYCRKHRIYTDTICVQEQTTVARASGEFCQSLGSHEFTGIFYGREKPQNITASMRDSMHQAISALAEACEIYRYKDIPVATGDASGGARYAYMAGFDILRHETFVGHHTLMLTGARGSARAFGKDNWGVHIASQHNAHPELEMGLRRFWLGMFMPWVYGCSFAFEEDTLYQLFKYIRSAGEDFMTKGKYNITKQFNKYVSTHPRDGECQVDIAILQGRYAPPFTGISSANDGNDNPYANENFPVWGHTGRQEWEWGFRQPEKGFHLFEIFAPGIFLPPLHQKKADVRKFFSGNPHGEFDQLPVEALVDVFKKYKFIALLSWHTMEYSIKEEIDRKANIPNDYFKFIEYVKNGGTLFMSIPHLTTRADRAFLKQMEDLKLYNDSNVQSLCGVRVCGKSGTEFCGEAELNESPECFDFNKNLNVKQNKIPSRNESEDGPCMIADVSLEGAEVILADKASGKPLLVRNKIGNGYVYLLLTYAYPGHEALKDLMPKILLAIVGEVKKTRQIQVTDSSGEIYWSNWKKDDSSGRVYMLNTDWTKPGNEKKAVVEKGNIRLSCNVLQGEIKQVIYFKNGMIHSANADDYLAIPQKMNNGRFEFTLQCPKNTEIKIVASKTYEVYIGENVVGKTQPNKEISFVIFNNSETMKYRISLTES